MQENEFERGIRETMDGLKLIPSEEVWSRVSANIAKEKRRKRLLFFLLPFALLLTGGLYFYINQNDVGLSSKRTENVQPEKTPTTNSRKIGLPEQSKLRKRQTEFSKAQLPTGRLELKHLRGENANSNSTKPGLPNKNTSTSTISSIGTFKRNLANGLTQIDIKHDSRSNEPGKYEIKNESENKEDRRHQEVSSIAEALPEAVDSVKEKKAVQTDIKSINDSTKPFVDNGRINKQIKMAANKWNIGLKVFGGLSNNTSGFRLSPVAAGFSNSPTQSTSTSNNASIAPLTYKSGFSYAFGVYAKKMMGRSTGFSVGVNYHLATATSNVGRRNNTATTVYDANLQNRFTVNESYNNGQTSTYKNKYHLFEIPLNVLLQLNNKGIMVSAGFTPAYLLASNALYVNNMQNIYYPSKSQFRTWQFSIQSGLQIPAFNLARFKINAGPEVQYGLNNMAKAANLTNQHLFSGGLKINVNLK